MEISITQLLDLLDEEITKARQEEPWETKVFGSFYFENVCIDFVLTPRRCEVEVYDEEKDEYYDEIASQLSEQCIKWDDVDVTTPDYWNEHGFANEADYLKYRYG